jgi:hypothetical protein
MEACLKPPKPVPSSKAHLKHQSSQREAPFPRQKGFQQARCGELLKGGNEGFCACSPRRQSIALLAKTLASATERTWIKASLSWKILLSNALVLHINHSTPILPPSNGEHLFGRNSSEGRHICREAAPLQGLFWLLRSFDCQEYSSLRKIQAGARLPRVIKSYRRQFSPRLIPSTQRPLSQSTQRRRIVPDRLNVQVD